MDLIALAQPLAPSSTNHRATAGSCKRYAEDISVTSEASVSPTSPSKSACSGKRFPSIEKLNAVHAKFWQYLPCGKERGAAQADNFGRRASKCAPGILPGDGAADWPAEKLPPSAAPLCARAQRTWEAPTCGLLQIPHHWRTLFCGSRGFCSCTGDFFSCSPLLHQSMTVLRPLPLHIRRLCNNFQKGHLQPSWWIHRFFWRINPNTMSSSSD